MLFDLKSGDLHRMSVDLAAKTWPTQTAQMHSMTESAIVAAARPVPPVRSRSSVCRLNAENVVYPPQSPIIKTTEYLPKPDNGRRLV